MAATKADIGTRALRKLAVLAAEELPSAADGALAAEKVDAVHAYLGRRGMLRWTADSVPEWAAEGVVMMTAYYLAPEFGVAAGRILFDEGEALVCSGIQVPQQQAPVPAEYF